MVGIPDAQHYPQNEQPELTRKHVLDFVKESDKRWKEQELERLKAPNKISQLLGFVFSVFLIADFGYFSDSLHGSQM